LTDLERRQDRAPVPSGWDYAPAPEAREIVTLEERYGLFIGGELVDPRSGEFFETLDPSTEEPLAEVAQAGKEDVDLAVGAARDAFENGWSDISPAERATHPRSARSTSSGSHGSSKSARASSRCLSR
jgi:aldehyde dehydrogenase (NAD+)